MYPNLSKMPRTKQKTRWGCLAAPIAFALLLIYGIIHDAWYRRQSIEVHLRDIFSESGFRVPDDVSKIRGKIGFKDFQGDFPACLTFTVRPDQIDQFMHLPESGGWRKPEDFKPIENGMEMRGGGDESNIEKIIVPKGTFMIEQWEPGYFRRYGVNPATRQIFFERSST